MKKIAKFLVEKRLFLAIGAIVLAVICAILSLFVEINSDMTKYLADGSEMRQGLTIMNDEFLASDDVSSIRVMFDDLTKPEIEKVREKLEGIQYVSRVDYEEDSDDYNKDNHTLFIVNSIYDYKTEEELLIEEDIAEKFADYKMQFENNDIQSSDVPMILLVSAVGMAVIILFIMCDSWLEPLIILGTIIVAVLVNLGTNIFFPYISDMSKSVAPIIQMALSMDYSIILLNSYYQNKKKNHNKIDAMKKSISSQIPSILSSSLTTVVGLLALVFLSFKTGPELGIILAKGVFISMVVVFMLLPALILWFDKLIEKTQKKTPHFKMGIFAKFSWAVRYVVPVIFVIAFAGSYIFQKQTGITFTEGLTSKISEIFPKDNQIVLIYNNKNENRINELIETIDDGNEHIKSVLGYTTTLGKPMTVSEMAEAVKSFGDDIPLDESVIQLLYTTYKDESLPLLTAAEFLNFLTDNVMQNEVFDDYIDDGLEDKVEYIKKLTDKRKLTTEISAKEMATLFDIKQKDVQKLYLYYFINYENIDAGKMTFGEFTDFVINTVARDPSYSSMFTESTLNDLKRLKNFTDVNEINRQRNYHNMAEFLGTDETTVKLVYAFKKSEDTAYTPSDKTVDEIRPALNEILGPSATTILGILNTLFPIGTGSFSYTELATAVGIDESYAKMIFTYIEITNGDIDVTMSAKEFVDYALANDSIKSEMSSDQIAQLTMLQKVMNNSLNNTKMSSNELADIIGMDRDQVRSIYLLYQSDKTDNGWKMTPQNFINFLISDVVDNNEFSSYFNDDTRSDLKMAKILIDAVVSEKQYRYKDMYKLISKVTDEVTLSEVEILYLYYSGVYNGNDEFKLTIDQLFNFIVDDLMDDEKFAEIFTKKTKALINDAAEMLAKAKGQLKTENYSRVVFVTDYIDESDEALEFIKKLSEVREEKLNRASYIVGYPEMVYEMKSGFNREYMIITIITAVAIFIVVATSFKNILLSAILTCLVQCGVFITVVFVGLTGGTMYYLALLIVQGILMGATIDYGIVFCDQYRESRKKLDRLEALEEAYNGSIHTIMTSGSILIIVTGILGMFASSKTIAQVCSTIAIGSIIAILMILLVLPGMLICFDKRIIKKNSKKKFQKNKKVSAKKHLKK